MPAKLRARRPPGHPVRGAAPTYLGRVTTASPPAAPAPLAALEPLLARATSMPAQSVDRGAVLACWMLARLLQARVADPPDRPGSDAARQRAAAAQVWCDPLALPPALRRTVPRACLALGGDDLRAAADTVAQLREAARDLLGPAALAPLDALVARARALAARP